jgi:phosphoenolpyruvate---glycerone phosphotransferase subunit DhaL
MTSFRNSDGAAIVTALIDAIHDHRQHLSDIDGLIGDGDHGINMDKGFQMCRRQLADRSENMSGSLALLGQVLMDTIGGSLGPLYGSVFRSMARVSRSAESIDAKLFAAMLAAAEQKIRDIGQCVPGEKTILDVLAPASAAFAEVVAAGGDFAAALDAMTAAAHAGREATTDMVAMKGRSARLGERSRGVPDDGATCCALILVTRAQTIKPLLR